MSVGYLLVFWPGWILPVYFSPIPHCTPPRGMIQSPLIDGLVKVQWDRVETGLKTWICLTLPLWVCYYSRQPGNLKKRGCLWGRGTAPLHQGKEYQGSNGDNDKTGSLVWIWVSIGWALDSAQSEILVLWECVKVYLFPVHLAAGPDNSTFSIVWK